MRKILAAVGLTGMSLIACGGAVNGATGDGGIDNGDASPCTDGPTAIVRQSGIDKIDILFMIDNSASMGDKQDYLKAAIPDLIKRLVQPNCVVSGKVVGQTDANGQCASGAPEFPPVHDMHIGVVTSALGPRLGDVCNPTEKTAGGLNKHNDDQGHLVNRATDDEHAMSDAQPSNFLAWFPNVPENSGRSPGKGAVPLTDLNKLEKDFADLISGVHQLGCGIESQLESWYRFLVQPDPYNSLDNPGGRAAWVDVDQTIIAQRHDFLRPDSAVAIIALSDENDSEIDVRSIGQQGWNWMSSGFQPPKGTSQCSNPADPLCTSCLLAPNKGAGDPNCSAPYSAENDWGYNLNLRHVHMKAKYGIDVQFPMQRYANGLTSPTVPNRDGEYPVGKANYVGNNGCTNPLFAASLPDGSDLSASTLCNLQRGTRTPDLVFYAHIGGVPNQLLHYVPGDAQASALTDADWTKILGRDPANYDYTGIDPHMVESFAPRAGLPPPSAADDADPISGREWITNDTSNFADLEYACTFPLDVPRDCSLPANADICDCPAAPPAAHDHTPPLCDAANVTQQIRAKAYPSVREALLAKMLGRQGVLASICPIDVVDNQGGSDPLFGYRPAVSALLDRIGTALSSQCLPEPLPTDASGRSTCTIYEVLPSGPCDASEGLADAPVAAAGNLRQKLGSSIAPNAVICEAAQLGAGDLVSGSCAQSNKPGWCYVTGAPAGTCGQKILFSPAGNPRPGSIVALQCAQTQCGL